MAESNGRDRGKTVTQSLGDSKAFRLAHVPRKKRKSPDGIATNRLIFSALQGTNDELFPQILSLYVAPGSTVADVTFGKGVFWKRVPKNRFELLATDLESGVDCRELPYSAGSIDCVVLDPPYMHTPGGTAHVNHQNYEGYYRNNSTNSARRYHESDLDLYFSAAREARRVRRDNGILIIKCADEVCANRQRLTHVEIINELTGNGFVIEDLFLLVRKNHTNRGDGLVRGPIIAAGDNPYAGCTAQPGKT